MPSYCYNSICGIFFRCKRWVINSRRDDLMNKTAQEIRQSCVYLCDLHFEKSQFMNQINPESGRLIWNAVPTLFDIPNQPPKLTVTRKLPQRTEAPPVKKRKTGELSYNIYCFLFFHNSLACAYYALILCIVLSCRCQYY